MTSGWKASWRVLVALALAANACGGPVEASPANDGCLHGWHRDGDRCLVNEIYFPGGTFTMGRGYCSEAEFNAGKCPLRDQPMTVTVAPFYLDATPFTWGEGKFLAGVPPGACDDDCRWPLQAGSGKHGIAKAEKHCEALGKRLVDEAQWEYAASAAGTRDYPWGNQPPDCSRAAFDYLMCAHLTWSVLYSKNMQGVPVASYPATSKGLYDMAGNLAELVRPRPDLYSDSYTAVPLPDRPGVYWAPCYDHPCGPSVLRGGGLYDQDSHRLLAAWRTLGGDRAYEFRCARPAK